jgi:hypothetical protein
MQDNAHEDANGVTNRTIEIATAAVLLAFSGLFLWSTYHLGIGWGAEGPQSGFFPFYVCLFIFVCSLWVLVHAIVGKHARLADIFVAAAPFRQVLSVLIPAMLFVVGVQLIGIYVAGAIYIAGFMRFIGKYTWLRSVLMAVIVCGAAFMMFEVWFQVQLYKGWWNPLSWTGY